MGGILAKVVLPKGIQMLVDCLGALIPSEIPTLKLRSQLGAWIIPTFPWWGMPSQMGRKVFFFCFRSLLGFVHVLKLKLFIYFSDVFVSVEPISHSS